MSVRRLCVSVTVEQAEAVYRLGLSPSKLLQDAIDVFLALEAAALAERPHHTGCSKGQP